MSEWWEVSWDIWTGLGLGVAGLAVGIGSWGYAASANRKARRIETTVGTFKSTLEGQVAAERAVVETEPVVPKRASLVALRTEDGKPAIANLGAGTAFDVRAVPGNMTTHLMGLDVWERIEPNEFVPVLLRSDSPFSDAKVEVSVSWVENFGQERTTKVIQFPRALLK